MPPAIISPSVLASDFGQLTAECKRMLRGGAQWLHMGAYGEAYIIVDSPFAECSRLRRRYGWVRVRWRFPCCLSDQPHL